MAVSYRSTGLYDSSGSTTAVVPAPAGMVDGDLIFVVLRRAAAVNPSGVPSGWTLLQSNLATYGFWVYYKIASGEGTSWTWTWAARTKTLGRSHAFYGSYDTNNPIQNSTTPYSATASGTPIDIPSLTTAASNTSSILISSGYSTSSKSFTVPANWTEHNDSGNTNPDFWQAIASRTIVSSGTTTGTIAYPISAASTYRVGCQILVNPPNNLPSVSLNSPDNAAQTFSTTPLFSFTGQDVDGDNLGCRIQIDSSTDFNSQSGSPLISASASSDSGFSSGYPYNSGSIIEYSVQSALSAGVYYWRVSANNPSRGSDYGSWSEIRSIEIVSNNPPQVSLNNPINTATGVAVAPTFNFTGTDPDGDTIEYEIQIDTLDTFNSHVGGSGGVIFSSSFELSDWISVLVSGASAAWTSGASSTNPSGISAQNGSYFAVFNSYTCQANASARYYSNTTFGIPSNASSASLSFWIYHDTQYSTNNDRVQLQISTNGGAGWTNVGTPASRYASSVGWEEVAISLNDYIGVSGILIGFLGISAYGNDCHIDNVSVSYNLPSTPLLYKNSSSDVGFTSGHPFTSGAAIEYTMQSADSLTDSTVYYWRVRAVDPLGGANFGAWSNAWSFSVGNLPPSVTLDFPNDSEMTSTLPVFTFTGSDPESDGVEYNLQIDTVATFDSQSGNPSLSVFSATDVGFSGGHPYASQTPVSYSAQSALALGMYYWRVCAIDPTGKNIYGQWSLVQTFEVVNNAPPSVTLRSPKNNATGTLSLPAFVFTGTDPENDNIEYELQIDTVNTFDSNGGGSGNVLFSNSFEAADWSSTLVSGSNASWSRITASSHPTGASPQAGSYLAGFNSYTCQANAQARYSNSASFSIPSNAGSPYLSFWVYHDNGYPSNSDRVQAQISPNGGSSWTNVGSAVLRYSTSVGWEKITVSLSRYIGSSNLLVGFLGISAYGNDCYIDNVSVVYNLPLVDKSSSIGDVGFASGHPYMSGNAVEYQLQSTNILSEGVMYFWRVRAIDPLGRNAFGLWSETRCFTPNTGMKIWDGASWNYKPVRIWNGSEWIAKPVKVWDGSDWVING